jgi:NAD(P)-dependent dehydrogenase (short-subunit alcohol dehydrogenase family)
VSRRVLITGAAGGIGAAAADELRLRGARVVGLDLHGDGAEVLRCDVRDQASVDRAVAAAVERLGGLDVLINNAGVGDPQSAGEAPDETALAVLDVNLVGPWRVTAAALPALRESRGRVVNVASGLAYLSVPLAPAYCMSKRGLVAYSDALRLEHGDAIGVTTVYPGYIRTGIHRASEQAGFGLEGVVPAEPVRSAARALARAALAPRAPRDLATTRRGAISYALARLSSRGLVDRVVLAHLRRLARSGRVPDAGLGGALVTRLRESR